MRQRMSEKKCREVSRIIGMPIRSMWHRGGRNPRYYDVFVEQDNIFGWFYPDTQTFEMSDTKWSSR